jgi:GNAT superfamily N-acetyltransferase
VHPSHRLHGVARQLTNWGLAKADEKRLDTYVTALPFAVPFYHKCGFVVVEEFNVNLGVDAEEPASEQWKRWATDDLRVIMMVRRCGEEAAVKED